MKSVSDIENKWIRRPLMATLVPVLFVVVLFIEFVLFSIAVLPTYGNFVKSEFREWRDLIKESW